MAIGSLDGRRDAGQIASASIFMLCGGSDNRYCKWIWGSNAARCAAAIAKAERYDMRIQDVFRGKGGSRTTLEKLKIDELRLDKIKLDQHQTRLIHRIEKAEKDKSTFFQRALSEDSNHRQRVYATKMKELETEVQGVQKQLQRVTQEKRIVDGLMLAKNLTMTASSEYSSVLSRVSLEDLAPYLMDATAKSEVTEEILAAIVRQMDEGISVVGGEWYESDEDIENIMSVIQHTRESVQFDDPGAVEEGLKKVDGILHKEDKEPI